MPARRCSRQASGQCHTSGVCTERQCGHNLCFSHEAVWGILCAHLRRLRRLGDIQDQVIPHGRRWVTPHLRWTRAHWRPSLVIWPAPQPSHLIQHRQPDEPASAPQPWIQPAAPKKAAQHGCSRCRSPAGAFRCYKDHELHLDCEEWSPGGA